MKKVVIMVCKKVSDSCSGSGCLKAFNQKKDAFAGYEEELELNGFTHCSGCGEEAYALLDHKIDKWVQNDIDVVHLSTCIRSKCHQYEDFNKRLSKHFEVMGYTHGSESIKKENTTYKLLNTNNRGSGLLNQK